MLSSTKNSAMPPGNTPLPAACRQMILVLAPSFSATQGTLYKFQRRDSSAAWERVAQAVPVIFGRGGLGWGRGLHPEQPVDEPHKHEGDGRSPAGVFRLGTAFGFPPAAALQPLRMPYQQITATLECVDDPDSRYYNTLADRTHVNADWHSSEKMLRVKVDYHLGVFVAHNTAPVKAGGGSCIFLHVWGKVVEPTAGCTAMEGKEMEKIIKWLDAGQEPVLVQLPVEAYHRLQAAWRLPAVE
ncbi:MAG: L,D-transpeptidase family protein [candidate division KSB1 bacterium]|nr:L,D-transpeptidase family protein [candidate division KSB1 bacterium]MDZ7273214.1 L,D-transpeptidase family protein [candidate division KSB1 bacterium]MDZ7285316.1 L,D-transpeptidase family protein [candidate division KSB1 bacterium]MDZ7298348.1 L,D-transpeptidase family protein [candidate division KSB1 bacterium]MDZ7308512.1 L,D-transpeptidase family protein [candidate division KSB1 bacterium]